MRSNVLIIVLLTIVLESFSQAPPILWNECFGGSGGESAWSFQITRDGGYIIAGSSTSNDGQVTGVHFLDSTTISSDFWILKLDSNRNIQWQKCFGGTSSELAFTIIESYDNGYVMVGNANSTNYDLTGNTVGSAIWIVKLDSLGELQWSKTFGGSGNDEGITIDQSINGTYVVAGFTSSNNGDIVGNHGGYDYWFLRIDSLGNLVSKKCFGGMNWEKCYSIKSTTHGGVILAGSAGSNDGDVSGNHSTNSDDLWVVLIDSSNNIVWQKCFGGTLNDVALQVVQTYDKGFVLAGNTVSSDGDVTGFHNPGSFLYDAWVVKIDSLGNLEWQKTVGGSNDDNVKGIVETSDSGFIASGFTLSDDGDVTGQHGQLDGWIFKLDKSGNLLWQTCVGGTLSELFQDVAQTNDGGIVSLGWTRSVDGDAIGGGLHGAEDIWLVKLASSVDVVELSTNFDFKIFPNPAFVSGLYFITLEHKSGTLTKKFFKQNF